MASQTVILTSGTRGDVQPLVALASGMARAGYTPRVVSSPAFRALVEERGLAFAPLAAAPNDLLGAPGLERALLLAGDPLRGIAHTLRFLRRARPQFERMLASAWEQCRECHALVLTLPTLAWGLSIAEALGVPAIAALLQPVGRTAAFASPLLPTRRSLGAALNRSSHDLIARTLWMPWRATINRWRRTRLGLAPIGAGGPFAPAERSGMPTLYGYSAQVLPAPPDWPDWRVVTGYWFLETPCGWTPPEKLARFVAQGSRPVYVGFGSMGAPRPELGALVVAALRQLGLRGILSLGPTLPPEQYGADMLCVGPTWHDWLFGHVDVVVHHGGAGTAAAGMRAGIPAIVAPVGVDQFFWAGRIAALGCGVDAGALYGLTRAGLVTALERACAAPVRARAAQLGAQLAAEDGIARAIAVLAASGRAAA